MEKTRKKQIRKAIGWAAMAIVVLVLAVLPMVAAGNLSEDGPQASILSEQAQLRTMETKLMGGGQLSSETSLNVTIPENVKLTGYLVGNGDTVQEGDPIATVDKVSVMTAITQVQQTLDLLTEQIGEESGETSGTSIMTKTGGTVKVVYAQPGDNVQNVMLEHGALAVVSLDGLMAVQIRRQTQLEVGDMVLVQFSDGTEVSGRVKSNLEDTLTVTLEDQDYPIGEKVVVTTEDAQRLGSGELYVLNQWNVTAYEGTISQVRISEKDTLRPGQTLFTLEDMGYSADFQRLVDQRQKYEALMGQLFQMHSSGIITAPCDGIVTGVDTNGVYMLDLQPSAESWKATVLAFFQQENTASAARNLRQEDGYRVSLLEAEPQNTVIIYLSQTQAVVGKEFQGTLTAAVGQQALAGTWSLDMSTAPAWLKLEGNLLSGTPQEAGTWQVQVSFQPQEGGELVRQTVVITSVNQAPAAYTGYPARVMEVTDGVLLVKQYEQPLQIADPENPPEVELEETLLTQDASYLSNLIKASQIQPGEELLLILDSAGNLFRIASLEEEPQQPEDNPGQGGQFPSGGMGGMGGSFPGGFSGGMQQEQEDVLYSLEKLTIASITSQKQMKLSILIDELDITKIYLGQEALITVDALAGERFAATVTEISASGENNGGNSKFTVELTLDKSGQMLPGMYGTAVMVLSVQEDVLTIPVAALEQQGSKTIVYTAYDEKSGNLSAPVTVTTGISDGEYVQILTGLSRGDTCWYAYYDTYVDSDSEEQQITSFGP